MIRFIKSLFPTAYFIDEGGTAASSIAQSEPQLQAPSPDEGSPATDPQEGQTAEAAPEGATENQDPAPPEESGKPGEVSAEDLLAAARFEDTPEELQARKDRELAASSTEARLKNEQLKARDVALKEQGLEPSYDAKGVFKGFKEIDGADVDSSAPTVESLTEAQQEQLVEDPDKVLKVIWAKAQKAFTRASATVTKDAVKPLNAAQQKLFTDEMAARKSANGELSFPTIADDMEVVNSLLEGYPEAVQDAYNAHPREMLPLLVNHVALQRERLLKWALDKSTATDQQSQTNRAVSDLSPVGEGNVRMYDTSSDAAKAQGSVIAKAE